MSVTEEKKQFESQVASLVGERITRVRYATLSLEDNEPHWDYGRFHNPEMGIELTLSSGDPFHIGWGWDFCQYGLALGVGAGSALWTDNAVMFDVSDEPNWSVLRQEPISSTVLYWHSSVDDDAPSDEYPQDLELVFGSRGSVWILAAQYDLETKSFWHADDEIMVTFDEDLLRQHRFGAYARPDWLRRVVRA